MDAQYAKKAGKDLNQQLTYLDARINELKSTVEPAIMESEIEPF